MKINSYLIIGHTFIFGNRFYFCMLCFMEEGLNTEWTSLVQETRDLYACYDTKDINSNTYIVDTLPS